MERVGESLLENNTDDVDIGSSLAQTIETFIDKVVLPEDMGFLDIQTNKITGTVSNCNYILFTKMLWREDNEGTFRSSSQGATSPPVYHTR